MLALLAAGAAAAVLLTNEPGDVSNPDVAFDVPTPTTPAGGSTLTSTAPSAPERSAADAFRWPTYGYDDARTKYLPLAEPLRPPFAERWKLGGSILLEFPPLVIGRSLYLLKNNGALYSIDRASGDVRWKSKLGYLAASSPAYAGNTLFDVLLQRGKGVKAGRIIATQASTGRTRWSRPLPSRSESSPLVHDGTVIFGTEDGTVYGVRASDGFTRWRYKADGAVKGAPAYADGKVIVADYAGKVHALDADTGRQLWEVGTSGARFGLGSGTFYATPAIAYGRVYIGNTDGFVYSFSTRDGKLAWRTKTGGFVYGSAAVAQVPGGRPMVYVGSYDRSFYALDARTGAVRWKEPAGGRVSGAATVVGDLVFFSTLEKRTTALGARTGAPVWRTGRGGFTPVVSNGRGIFLVGFTTLYGLDGRPPADSAVVRAARRRAVGRRVARERRAERRALARRVAARRRAVRRRNALRRSGARVCVKGANGKRTCRRPAPLVCLKRSSDGRTICRVRRR